MSAPRLLGSEPIKSRRSAEISQHLGLSTWDKPSFACLSSRFPYGMEITKENLARVDTAETILRDEGFRFFRVRFHDTGRTD